MRDWLANEGWKDEVFLDLDPQRGIAAGERWERALNEAASRCEAVLFLVSKAWLGSRWCLKEFHLAHRLNKRLFGVLIENLSVDDLPEELAGTWQIVRLATGRDHVMLRAVLPVTHEEVNVTFSAEGLQRLKHGLEQAGLDPKHFAWPPANNPNRPPYRGLRPLEAEDAGIFFGRDAPVIEALDELRGLRETTPPRLLVILGASGSGKSSFLRAGVLPRLKRDDRHFLPLSIIRPDRAAINGESGLLPALEEAFYGVGIPTTRAKLRAAIEGGASTLRPLLRALADKATPSALDADAKPTTATLILSVPAVDHTILKSDFRRRIICPPTLALLDLIVDGSNTQEPVDLYFNGDDLFAPFRRRRGLPIGNLTSQFFANVYLDGFDHFVTEVLRAPYVRYVDDFALFHNDPAILAEWGLRIELYLAGRRLKLHPRKTMILSCTEPSQFLGFVLYADGRRRLPDDNVRRFCNRLRGLRDRWRAGTIGVRAIRARVGAWIAHAEHADTWRLRHAIFQGGRFDPARALEAWMAPCRRVVRGGSWNNNPQNLRSANRNGNTTDNRNNNLGFRVGSTLSARASAIRVALGAH